MIFWVPFPSATASHFTPWLQKRGPLAMRRLMLPMWAQRIFAVEGEVLRFSRSWSDKLPAGSINLRVRAIGYF